MFRCSPVVLHAASAACGKPFGGVFSVNGRAGDSGASLYVG